MQSDGSQNNIPLKEKRKNPKNNKPTPKKNTKRSKQSQKLFRSNTKKGRIEFINVRMTSIWLHCSELLKLKSTYIKYY